MNPERLFLAGLSAYRRGARMAPGAYCERALRESSPTDDLRVRLNHLYLVATELWWFSNTPYERLGALVDSTLEAAERTGDPALLGMANCVRGRYLLITAGLQEAVAAFTIAAQFAADSENLLAQLESLSDLGHHVIGLDMARGLGVLQEAMELTGDTGQVPACDLPLVAVLQARLPGLVGVAAFDNGRFGDAEGSLRRSVSELHRLRAWDQFSSISNYLGQLLTAMGRFEEAEKVLLAALKPLYAHADLTTSQGYNLGLLGKLYLEWGRLDAAEKNITAGWERLLDTGHSAVLPILRNYLGELLMHPSNPHRDVGRARQLFDETIAECQRSGFQRSEIAALSLRALVDLSSGRHEDALAASACAVEHLAAVGTMPALRTEEIYLTRYKVLRATGAEEEAASWLACAREVLNAKAATIPSLPLREQFLTGTPVSRYIVAHT
jgi:tetratricopeptide (TPR) repeat protein